MTEPLRLGYFAPDQDTDERALQTIAANIGHDSDTTILLMAEISRRNSDALVLSATGVDLDSDLTVSVGHRHNDRDHALEWMDSQSFSFAAGAGVTGGDLEGYLVERISATLVGVGFLQIPLVADGGTCIYSSIRWRFRARVPASGYTSCTLTVKIGVGGDQAIGSPFAERQVTIGYDQTDLDFWTEGPPLYANEIRSLQDSDGTPFLLYVYAHVDTQAATLFEVQIQWGPQ